MKNTIFNKAFIYGFLLAFVTFIFFNCLTFFSSFDSQIRNSVGTGGFPLPIYEWGGEPYVERILMNGVTVDVAVGIIYSSFVGMFFGWLWWRDLNKEKEGVLYERKEIL
jgi:hypothetical protein